MPLLRNPRLGGPRDFSGTWEPPKIKLEKKQACLMATFSLHGKGLEINKPPSIKNSLSLQFMVKEPFSSILGNLRVPHLFCFGKLLTSSGRVDLSNSFLFLYAKIMERITLLETNVAPEKWWLGDDPCFRGHVNFGDGILSVCA